MVPTCIESFKLPFNEPFAKFVTLINVTSVLTQTSAQKTAKKHSDELKGKQGAENPPKKH